MIEGQVAICLFVTFGLYLGGYYVGKREAESQSEEREQKLIDANNKLAIMRTIILRLAPHGRDCRHDVERKCTCWKGAAMAVLGGREVRCPK